LRCCLKRCLIKDMSKQELPTVRGAGDEACCVAELDAAECCAPLVAEPLSDAGAEGLAPLFKAVADPVRLRLLSLIACHEGGESCVCDLTDAFEVSGPAVSYHLRILREAGLISSERRGTWVYYRVNRAVMARMSAVLVPSPVVLAGVAG
jgi:ArsR family transcriptional regulator, arsenate/arsenite/antimonite-responsive transcriptional repressor